MIPGSAAGRVLKICNDGDDTLSFTRPGGGPVIDSYERPFQISEKSLGDLVRTRLAPGECASVIVTFLSPDVGSYRTVARIWSNAARGRDTSVWTARTVAHRPIIKSVDFGTHRVAGGTPCSKNPAPPAGDNVYLANLGADDCVIRSMTIGAGTSAFALDTADAASLRPGAVVPRHSGGDTNYRPIRVLFVPAEEGTHSGALVVTMTDGTSVTATLEGDAVEAHVAVSDTLTFPTASTRPGGYSRTTAVIRSTGSCALTVSGFSLDGEPGEYRVISSPELPAVLQPGDVLGIELEFTPRTTGKRIGRLLVSGDHSICDDSTSLLVGTGTDAAGMREPTGDRELEKPAVHPNPTDDRVMVTLHGCRGGWLRAELFDMVGRMAGKWELDPFQGSAPLSLRDIPPGEYYLRLVTPHGVTGAGVRVSR